MKLLVRRAGAALRWLAHFVALIGFVLRELVVSSLRVAWDVVTPRDRMSPGVLAVPLGSRRKEEITLVAIIISLMPGTLALDVSEDRTKIYVHAMYVKGDPDGVRRDIQEGIGRRVGALFRRSTEGAE